MIHILITYDTDMSHILTINNNNRAHITTKYTPQKLTFNVLP